MRRPSALPSARLAPWALLSLAVLAAVPAEAQVRRERDTIILNVRPRSYLDAGKVVPVGSLNRYASGQIASYLNQPPYIQMKDRFGEGTLPDPVINGPFVGARNPFGPVDYEAPGFLR